MDIQLINSLYDSGTLSEMYQAGFVSSKIFTYRDIYLWVQAQIATRHISKTKAVVEAEEKFNLSRPTIWAAVNSFR